jgi:hypothetical protein
MHRMLLALWLVGAALYAGFSLVPPPDQPLVETAKRADPATSQPPKAAAPQRTATAEPTGPTAPPASSAQGVETGSPAEQNQAAVPDHGTSSTERSNGDPQGQGEFHHNYGEISRGAPVHGGPSVASEIVGYAAAGAAIELLERRAGWVKFVDPATQKEGWIYEIYVSTERQKGLGAEPMPQPTEEAAIDPDDGAASEPRQPRHSLKSKNAKKQFVSKRKRFKFARRFRRR